jgi:hypothetical protein
MKSPWKFLAQLGGRRRPAETPESSVGDDADATASESESDARQTPAPSSNATEASGRRDHDENPTVDFVATTSNETDRAVDMRQEVSLPFDGEEVRTPARDEVNRSRPDAHALVPESRTSKKPPRISRTKRPGQAKTTLADMVSKSTSVANGGQSAQSLSSRESFFDEVASLDEEIRQLRSQLAQKLHSQNVQLIKMLERFDRS